MRFFFGPKAIPPQPETSPPSPALQPRVVPAPMPPPRAVPAPAPQPQEAPPAAPRPPESFPSAPVCAAPVAAPAAAGGKARAIALYQALLSGLYDGVLIVDAKGHVMASNQRILHFTGFTEAELWNMPCDRLIAAMTPRVLAKITAYVEAGRFTVVNAECRRKDGAVFSAEIAISRIHFLNEGDFVFSIRNLDRREKARLRHELEIDALTCAGAGIAVCSLDGIIEYGNPALLELLQLPEEKDMVRRPVADCCAAPDAARALLRDTVAQGFGFGRLDLKTRDGGSRPVIVTAGVCPAKPDAPARLVLTLTALPKSIG